MLIMKLLKGNLPSSFGLLTNLAVLALFANSFNGTHGCGKYISALSDCILNYNCNCIGVIPSAIGTIAKLTNLALYSNCFTGTCL